MSGLGSGSGATPEFRERWPGIVSPNPGGCTDPLGESVLDPANAPLRVFEPHDLRLVLGRAQDPQRELLLDQVRADAVPVHRRITGGGTVVLAPGSVVVALRAPPWNGDVASCFARINRCLRAAVRECCAVEPGEAGHGDLVIPGPGAQRKILGASLRRQRAATIYLGVLLVADLIPLMERYLATPSRRPDYRGQRDHRAFCTDLARHGASVAGLIAAVEAACAQLPTLR
ncbi:MAG: lipoate--protein ligase family protein [Planctomycetota bacterium]